MRMIVPQLSIWKFGLGVLDIDTILDSLWTKRVERCSLEGYDTVSIDLKA